MSPPSVFPLTQAPPDFEPVIWSEFSLFFSADFLEVDGVTYVIKDSVAYKDCPDCGSAYPLPLLRSHIKVRLGLWGDINFNLQILDWSEVCMVGEFTFKSN